MAKASSRVRTANSGEPVAWESAERSFDRPLPKGRVITCCWPIGEPGTREFHLCDLPTEPGLPYCAEHVKVAGPGRLQTDDSMARQLSQGFAEAAREVVRQAHAAGLAVPAREGGVAVEIRPDGEVVPIDENATWSPTDWRKSAKH
jgi:hypothetical protein